MAINSRAKGNRAERTVLKILKKHFGGEPWERKSMGIPGPDLLTPDNFPYAVEIKDDKSVRLKHFWKPNKQLKDFWEQAESQANGLGLEPLLIAKVEGIWFCWIQGYRFDYAMEIEEWCVGHKSDITQDDSENAQPA